jgi:hypothetical protein
MAVLSSPVENRSSGSLLKKVGCVLQLAVMLVITGLVIRYVITPFMISGGGMVDTRPVPGDATRFDPVAAYNDIMAYAGSGAQLVSITATYVRSDGTQDLTASYYPYTNYDFVLEVPTPADAPPVGAGGTTSGTWYEPIEIRAYQPNQWRKVSGTNNYSYMNQGMQRDTSSPSASEPQIIRAPKCSFADLWEVALRRDAPRNAVAIIEYDQEGYSFIISDVSIYLQFDAECNLIDD